MDYTKRAKRLPDARKREKNARCYSGDYYNHKKATQRIVLPKHQLLLICALINIPWLFEYQIPELRTSSFSDTFLSGIKMAKAAILYLPFDKRPGIQMLLEYLKFQHQVFRYNSKSGTFNNQTHFHHLNTGLFGKQMITVLIIIRT